MEKESMSDLLQLSPEAMRRLGYRVVDQLVDHFMTLPDMPVTRTATRTSLETQLREPLPQQGVDVHAALDLLDAHVWNTMMHLDHPRFFGFVPGPSNFVGAMADALVAGLNPFAGTWLEASGCAEIELVTIDWLCRLAGLPTGARGHFVSGGSAANLTALAVARHARLDDRAEDAVLYCSDQTHSSVDRALHVLGFRRSQVRRLPTDQNFRVRLPALQEAVNQDRSAGLRPFCVVANVGTTNTGAVDPLGALADFCGAEELWLHADGAYGAAALFSTDARAALAGIDRVDSLALDPHKWLFQPYEIGCVLVRDGRLLRKTFDMTAEYLEVANQAGEEVNFFAEGMQLTRSFRALKLWLSLKTFGADAFGRAIDHGIELAELAARRLAEVPGWEIAAPAQLAIVAFRYAPAGLADEVADAINRDLVDASIRDGFAFISSTTLHGHIYLRLCTINPRTTADDVRELVRRLETWRQSATRDLRRPSERKHLIPL